MYKLFLCLRYLRLRFIAYLPMAAVAVSVFLMLVSISVMNGFLEKIEVAAKGLYGDIVVEPQTLSGIGYYDEFIKEITDPNSPDHVPGVKAGAPFIITQGLLGLPGTDSSIGVQIVGVRLAQWQTDAKGNRRLNDFDGHVYSNVSSFAKGLDFQKGLAEPTFNPPWELLQSHAQELHDQTLRYYNEYLNRKDDAQHTLGLLASALRLQQDAIMRLTLAPRYEQQVAELNRQIRQAKARPQPDQALIDDLQSQLDALTDQATVQPDDQHIILGTMVHAFRTKEGKIVRRVTAGYPVFLTLVPLGQTSSSGLNTTLQTWGFTVVDDCRTDVSGIDSSTVYLPFDKLQQINKMSAMYAADDPRQVVQPARSSQIQFRTDDSLSPAQLE